MQLILNVLVFEVQNTYYICSSWKCKIEKEKERRINVKKIRKEYGKSYVQKAEEAQSR